MSYLTFALFATIIGFIIFLEFRSKKIINSDLKAMGVEHDNAVRWAKSCLAIKPETKEIIFYGWLIYYRRPSMQRDDGTWIYLTPVLIDYSQKLPYADIKNFSVTDGHESRYSNIVVSLNRATKDDKFYCFAQEAYAWAIPKTLLDDILNLIQKHLGDNIVITNSNKTKRDIFGDSTRRIG